MDQTELGWTSRLPAAPTPCPAASHFQRDNTSPRENALRLPIRHWYLFETSISCRTLRILEDYRLMRIDKTAWKEDAWTFLLSRLMIIVLTYVGSAYFPLAGGGGRLRDELDVENGF